MTPIQKAKEILKAFCYCEYDKKFQEKIAEEKINDFLATPEAAAILSGEDWKEDGEEKDRLAIAFAVWALHDPQAQSYIASGVTAYKLLELYKDRPYINTDPKIN